MELAKYSIGVGDRFGHEAKAQLTAIINSRACGVPVAPVWNKYASTAEAVSVSATATVFEFSPAAKLIVPDAAVKCCPV